MGTFEEMIEVSRIIENANALMILYTGVLTIIVAEIARTRIGKSALQRITTALYPTALGGLNLNRFFWPLLLVAALAVRLPLMNQALWYDETWSGSIAQLPLSSLPAIVMADVHPPLPYLLFWLSGQIFGSSEFAIRMPSLAIGVFSIYLVYRLSKSLFGVPAARAAAGLFALMPVPAYYAAEARGYALLLALVLVAGIAIQERRHWLFIASAGLLAWTHSYGYLYAGVFVAAALVINRWFRPAFLVGVIACVWLPFMLAQSADVSDGFWIQPPTVAGTLSVIWQTTLGTRMSLPVWLASYIPALALTWIGLWSKRSWLLSQRGLLWLLVAVGVPALAGALTYLWEPIWLHRAMLPVGVMFVMLWGHVLATSRYKHVLRMIFIPSLLLASISSVLPEYGRRDLRPGFDLCESASMVYAMTSSAAVMAQYYTDQEVIIVPPGADDLNQFIADHAKDSFGMFEIEFDSLMGTICLISQRTTLSEEEEVATLERITSAYPVLESFEIGQRFYQFEVYLIDAR